jgi:hypothetical protein
MLNDNVYKLLEVLHQVKWFENCGKPLELEESMIGNIDQCLTWEQAVKEADSYEWKCIKNEAVNQITQYLDAKHRKIYQTWNLIIDEIRPLLNEVYEDKILFFLPSNLNKELGQSIRKDILRLLIEAHWSYLVQPVFFTPVTFWYIKGHFPCGWRGDFPNGQLLVY